MYVNYDIYMQDPSQQNLDELDKAEGILLSQTEYQACIEYGEKQVEYLKVLDSMDILTEKLRFYNVCRAKAS
eukprot:5293032-Prorocentrum_lima.AAC.1